MKFSVETGSAQVLTLEKAKRLRGKRIATIYFGYNGQDGVDEFVVGDVKREILKNGKPGKMCLFTDQGRNTCIRTEPVNNGEFYCSDIDRQVFYLELDEN